MKWTPRLGARRPRGVGHQMTAGHGGAVDGARQTAELGDVQKRYFFDSSTADSHAHQKELPKYRFCQAE